MPQVDRRKPANAPLREKIDRLQAARQKLIDSVDQVQAHTLAWARQHDVVQLPNAQLAQELSAHFKAQRATLAQIERDIAGGPAVPQTKANLITDAELAALMKPE